MLRSCSQIENCADRCPSHHRHSINRPFNSAGPLCVGPTRPVSKQGRSHLYQTVLLTQPSKPIRRPATARQTTGYEPWQQVTRRELTLVSSGPSLSASVSPREMPHSSEPERDNDPSRKRTPPPALPSSPPAWRAPGSAASVTPAASNRLFQVLRLCWRSLQSGDLRYIARQWKKTI